MMRITANVLSAPEELLKKDQYYKNIQNKKVKREQFNCSLFYYQFSTGLKLLSNGRYCKNAFSPATCTQMPTQISFSSISKAMPAFISSYILTVLLNNL